MEMHCPQWADHESCMKPRLQFIHGSPSSSIAVTHTESDDLVRVEEKACTSFTKNIQQRTFQDRGLSCKFPFSNMLPSFLLYFLTLPYIFVFDIIKVHLIVSWAFLSEPYVLCSLQRFIILASVSLQIAHTARIGLSFHLPPSRSPLSSTLLV